MSQPCRIEEEARKLAGTNFVVNSRFKPFAVRDGLLITGQQQYSGGAAAKLVIEALDRLMKGRTVITVAHRLSTIRDVDKIVVFNDGVVAEQGTHDELLALGGVYAGLHRIQIDPGAAPPAAKTSTA